MQSHDAKPRKNNALAKQITGKRKPSSKGYSVNATRPTKEPKKRMRAKPSKKHCRFEDSMAEHSGDWTDGCENYENSKEEIEKLPTISSAEKVVSDDELENLKDTVIELMTVHWGVHC
jgi:hypothetical protein